MQLKAVQWNIGGGKILSTGSDPVLMSSYSDDGLGYIVDYLISLEPDVITLQEIHINDGLNQAEYIANQLGMSYWVSDILSDSHVEEGQKLGQAIISKHPITDKTFQLYVNPNKQTMSEDGTTTWYSHDKGVTRASVKIGEESLAVATTHLTPFRLFSIDVDSAEGRRILDDVEHKLTGDSNYQLIQGDFNLNYALLGSIFPRLVGKILDEVPQGNGTTPKGSRYDHVLYRGLRLIESITDRKTLTDHYPVITKFEL